MSDDETPPTEPAAPPGPKPPKIVLGLLAGNLALTAFMVFKVLTAAPAHAAGPAAAHADADKTETPSRELTGPLVALEPLVVNLNEPGSPRYLKAQIQAEVRDGAGAKAFEKNKTLIRDDVMSYLSNLRVAETLGDENKSRIRTDLLALMGAVIGEKRVRRVVFSEFVVQ